MVNPVCEEVASGPTGLVKRSLERSSIRVWFGEMQVGAFVLGLVKCTFERPRRYSFAFDCVAVAQIRSDTHVDCVAAASIRSHRQVTGMRFVSIGFDVNR